MAKGFIRKIARHFFSIPTIIIAGLFLMSKFFVTFSGNGWWIWGLLGLAMPYFIILLFLAIFFWLTAKPLYALIPFLTLVIGYKEVRNIFAFNIPHTFKEEKSQNDIRIVSWNVGNLGGITHSLQKSKEIKQEIVSSIFNAHPDIICLQEFNNSLTRGNGANNMSPFLDDYPYYYFNKDIDKDKGAYQYGCVVFSKYPIIHSQAIKYGQGFKESSSYVDILLHQDTVRIYNAHLQSFRFNKNDYGSISALVKDKQILSAGTMNLLEKMKLAFELRSIQANIIKDSVAQSPYQTLVCGDFNDVPNSFAYKTIKGDKQDAFLKVGTGVGRTYASIAPTLRIDYIMPDSNFLVKQFNIVDEDLSDHFMLVSDLSLKK